MDPNSLQARAAHKESVIDLTDSTEKTELISNNMSGTYAPAFEMENYRLGFIQKLLSIKLLQSLVVTVVMVGFVAGGYRVYSMMVLDTIARIHFIVVATLAFLVVVAILHFFARPQTKPFDCYILLTAYPFSGGFFISVILYGWALNSMLLSWVQFNFVLFALVIYSIWSFETKIEFKTSTGLYMSAGILIVTYVFTVPFIYDVNGFAVLYFSLMIFLTTTYVLYEIEDLVSKDYKASLTPADFVKAALYMHVDHRHLLMKIYNKHKRDSMNVYD